MYFSTSSFTNLRYSNTLESEGRNGTETVFKHPFLQCWGLSVGEFACILIFLIWNSIKDHISDEEIQEATKKPKSSFSPFLFLPAAILHLTSRSLIFLALTFTTASSFQMLSGSNIIFTCVLSRIFLKRVLPWTKWLGVLTIVIGD